MKDELIHPSSFILSDWRVRRRFALVPDGALHRCWSLTEPNVQFGDQIPVFV
jgi:hypothetical protein